MPTIPKHHAGPTRNAYPVACGICGVPWPRSRMRKDGSGQWVCPDEGRGRDRTTLDRANARIQPFHGPRPIDAPVYQFPAADADGQSLQDYLTLHDQPLTLRDDMLTFTAGDD